MANDASDISPEKSSQSYNGDENLDFINNLLKLSHGQPAIIHDSGNPSAKYWPDKEKPITYEEAKRGTDFPVRIYADGVYDMFHVGHARLLMQAKNCFPNVYVIAGVNNDADTLKYKGPTVMTETERYESVRHCRYVNEIICGVPWEYPQDFIREHKIDFVVHEDMTSTDEEYMYTAIKEAGKFVATQRTEGISTSDLITRILKDYHIYAQRNLKRGFTWEEMNVDVIPVKDLALSKNTF